MDKLETIEIYDSIKNKKVKVYVSLVVAKRCKEDSDFAEDLFKQLQDQNIEEGSVLEIETVEADKTDHSYADSCGEEAEYESNQNNDLSDSEVETDVWTRGQTMKFLKTYQLYKKKKNCFVNEKQFWCAVARELIKYGINKHYSKCALKFDELLRSFKATKRKKNSNLNTTFAFHKEMNDILNELSDINEVDKKKLKESKSAIKTVDEPKSKTATCWTSDETLKLISLCKKYKDLFQERFNRPLWERISKELADQGVNADVDQCRIKWNILTKEYRRTQNVPNQKFDFTDAMKDALCDDNGDLLMEDEDLNDSCLEEADGADEGPTPTAWEYNENNALIEAYSKYWNKSNNKDGVSESIWEQVAAELQNNNNITKTPKSCQQQWKILYKLYKTQKELNINNKFDYYDAIDRIYQSKEQGGNSFAEKKCECSKKRYMEKQKRHIERMEMLKRKLDLEERKIRAFEEYMSEMRNKMSNGKT